MSISSLLPDPAGLIPVAAPQHLAVGEVATAPSWDLPLPLPLPGVGGWLGDSFVNVLTGMLRVLSKDYLDALAAPVARYALSTPDLLAERTLRSYWTVSLSVLLACVGLTVAIAGLAMIPGHTRLSHGAREAVTVRLPACLLTAAISLPLVALEVELANRMVHVFIGESLSRGDNPLFKNLLRAVSGDAGSGLALMLTVTVAVVLLAALVVVGLIRWATLWLLIVLAPIGMGFALLPGGEGVARVWWRLQLATVFLPVANAVLLGTYVAMFSSTTQPFVGALSGVAVLALMTKLPGWIAGAAVGVDSSEVSHRLRRGSRSGTRIVQTVGSTSGPGRAATAARAATAGGQAVGGVRPVRAAGATSGRAPNSSGSP